MAAWDSKARQIDSLLGTGIKILLKGVGALAVLLTGYQLLEKRALVWWLQDLVMAAVTGGYGLTIPVVVVAFLMRGKIARWLGQDIGNGAGPNA